MAKLSANLIFSDELLEQLNGSAFEEANLRGEIYAALEDMFSQFGAYPADGDLLQLESGNYLIIGRTFVAAAFEEHAGLWIRITKTLESED